jgi:hypothetical protein
MSTVPTISSGSYSKRLVLLIWMLVGFFYFFLSWGYIRVTMDDQQFSEYLQHVVNIAGSEERPAKEIRALLLVKADQLNLPVRGDQIAIAGSGTFASATRSILKFRFFKAPSIRRKSTTSLGIRYLTGRNRPLLLE